jgi:hypothetical protein
MYTGGDREHPSHQSAHPHLPSGTGSLVIATGESDTSQSLHVLPSPMTTESFGASSFSTPSSGLPTPSTSLFPPTPGPLGSLDSQSMQSGLFHFQMVPTYGMLLMSPTFMAPFPTPTHAQPSALSLYSTVPMTYAPSNNMHMNINHQNANATAAGMLSLDLTPQPQ